MMPTNDSNDEEDNNITLKDKVYQRKNQILIATLLILTGVTITVLVVVSDSYKQGKFQPA